MITKSLLKGYICTNITVVHSNKLSYFFLLAIIVCCSSCKKWPWQDCEKGTGDVFEDRRSFANYHTFTLDIPSELYIHYDSSRSRSEVMVVAQENVAEQIIVTDNDGFITVGFDGCFREYEEIQFHLFVKSLEKLVVNSPAKVYTTKAIYGEKFHLVFNESASLDAFFYVDELQVDFRGAANIKTQGYAHVHKANFNSAATYDAQYLITDSTYVIMNSTSTFKAYASGLLDVTMTQGVIEFDGEDTLNFTDRKTGGVLLDLRDSL